MPSPSVLQAVLQLPAAPAWDVWSLGCTLFEAATGTPLFKGIENAAAAAAARGLAGPLGSHHPSEQDSSGAGDERVVPWQWRAEGDTGSRQRQRLEWLSDATHLAMMRRLLGPLPPSLLERSPVASLFVDGRSELLLAPSGRRLGLEERLSSSGALGPPEVRRTPRVGLLALLPSHGPGASAGACYA